MPRLFMVLYRNGNEEIGGYDNVVIKGTRAAGVEVSVWNGKKQTLTTDVYGLAGFNVPAGIVNWEAGGWRGTLKVEGDVSAFINLDTGEVSPPSLVYTIAPVVTAGGMSAKVELWPVIILGGVIAAAVLAEKRR